MPGGSQPLIPRHDLTSGPLGQCTFRALDQPAALASRANIGSGRADLAFQVCGSTRFASVAVDSPGVLWLTASELGGIYFTWRRKFEVGVLYLWNQPYSHFPKLFYPFSAEAPDRANNLLESIPLAHLRLARTVTRP